MGLGIFKLGSTGAGINFAKSSADFTGVSTTRGDATAGAAPPTDASADRAGDPGRNDDIFEL